MAKKRRFIIDIDEETNRKKLVVGDVILLIIFGGLIALVVNLALTVMKEKDNPINTYSDLVIPVIEKDSTDILTVDLSAIKNKEYTIKVTNYRDKDKINKEEISYDFEVINEKNIAIEIYKNEIKDNLESSQNDVLIEKNILSSKVKQDDVYKIVVTTERALTEDDIIKIKVSS